jgi:hemoglobin
MTAEIEGRPYGEDDASFQAAGGEAGLRRLVDAFYNEMERLPGAVNEVRVMHPDDLGISRDKLTLFLCGWLGGPKLFSEKYGPIRLPTAHKHLDVRPEHRDAWLLCMAGALATQPYRDDFKIYLMEQLAVPAERVHQVSQAARQA